MTRDGTESLTLVAGELRKKLLDSDASAELKQRSEWVTERGSAADQLLHPRAWERHQLIRLLAASVLQSYLRNVRIERLTRFDLERHPRGITLAQLARMHDTHSGVVGQTFEFAVADAVNAGVPEVVDPVRRSLRNLGLDAKGHIGIILLGLEKVAPDDKERVYSLIRDSLPTDGVLRSGRPGRPMTVDTLLGKISSADWRSLSNDERRAAQNAIRDLEAEAGHEPFVRTPSRQQVSQLGRADALIFVDNQVVAASLKVNPRHVPTYGWRDVPLWITTTGRLSLHEHSMGSCPREVVALPPPFEYDGLLVGVVQAVDNIMRLIDTNRRPRNLPRADFHDPTFLLWRSLYRFKDAPLADLIDHLRETADPAALAAASDAVQSENVQLKLPLLNNPAVRDAHLQQAIDGTFFKLQGHLFVPSQ